MNDAIVRLFLGLLFLFSLLVAFTSNWAVFDADELKMKTENKRPLFEAQQIERGKIFTSDGAVIADSRQKGAGDQLRYIRQYPEGALFGNPIGYSFITQGTVGFERSEQSVLTGEENEFTTILDQIRGQQREGSDIVTTLDADAQQLATDQLAAQPSPGAVVAIVPDTGAVRVMASTPGYDPNTVPSEIDQLNQADPSVLKDRTIQEPYPPGSTMKVVTAAAALDSGAVDADEPIDSPSGLEISGVPLANDFDEDFPGETMEDALTNSVNTYFAQVGERVGAETLLDYMKRFGFEKDPEVEIPDGQKAPSGVYAQTGDGLRLTEEGFDIGRVAIGQGGQEGQLLATPFQMAEVAATVANGGQLMRPTLVQEIKDPDGRTTESLDPEVQSEVISEDTAEQLTQMMTSVVNNGTAAGLAGDLGGTTFAGKTGTAEINIPQDIAQPWFIAFAPVEDPQIAVAATIERCVGCFGGDTAGPIATAVMAQLLSE